MRKDLVGGGAATFILMIVAYEVMGSAALAVPPLMTTVALSVAAIGAGLVGLGLVLKATR